MMSEAKGEEIAWRALLKLSRTIKGKFGLNWFQEWKITAILLKNLFFTRIVPMLCKIFVYFLIVKDQASL